PIQFSEPDTLRGPHERTGGLQKEPGLVDNGRMLRVVLMDLSVAFHLVEVFLIVHRRANDLAGIGYRTQKRQIAGRNDWRIRRNDARPFHDFVEIGNQEVVSWKRISIGWQHFQSSCNVPDIRAFNQAQSSVTKPAKSHVGPLRVGTNTLDRSGFSRGAASELSHGRRPWIGLQKA